jgi:hypothetical protein
MWEKRNVKARGKNIIRKTECDAVDWTGVVWLRVGTIGELL